MKVVRVQFRKVSKKYFFNPGSLTLKKGDIVVVETIRGLELGEVFEVDVECPEAVTDEIKPVLRIATKHDFEQQDRNQEQIPEVTKKVKALIKKNNLDMKLISCEFTLDHQKLIISFDAEERVDFRQLVKDLAEEFRLRIELRQIGSRDGAKLIGGLGPCGFPICCVRFIDEFDNVSIKMAKNQNLSLNPQKISGTCGKLLCCIKFENDLYTELRIGLPEIGDTVTLEEGDGKVISVDVLKRSIKVKMYETEGFLTKDVKAILAIKSKKNPKDKD